MKKFNRRFIKGTNWALAGLLGMLGITGCDTFDGEENYRNDEYGTGMMSAYGTPHAEYVVSGMVKSEKGKVLGGIRVVIPEATHFQYSTENFIPDKSEIKRPVNDTVYTVSDGTFKYKYVGFPSQKVRVSMKIEDPTQNPSYDSKEEKVDFLPSELKNGKGWSGGSAEKKIKVALKLKKK